MVKENNRDNGDVKLFPKIIGIALLLKNEPSTSHRSENWPSPRSSQSRLMIAIQTLRAPKTNSSSFSSPSSLTSSWWNTFAALSSATSWELFLQYFCFLMITVNNSEGVERVETWRQAFGWNTFAACYLNAQSHQNVVCTRFQTYDLWNWQKSQMMRVIYLASKI